MIRTAKTHSALFAAALACALGPLPAAAVDGAIEINAAAAAEGINPSDPPGLPVRIVNPGLYRLTGNLTTANPNQTILSIEADGVTLDLGGFLLEGPGVNGSGLGIDSSGADTVVKNGTVFSMGFDGLALSGENSRVENVTVRANRNNGMSLGAFATVRNCLLIGNGRFGVEAGNGSSIVENVVALNGFANVGGGGIRTAGDSVLIQSNVVDDNRGVGVMTSTNARIIGNAVVDSVDDGIEVDFGSVVKDNLVRANGDFGLDLNSFSGFIHNVVDGVSTVDGGAQFGPNLCNGAATCP
ncbi:MAG: right-handed parallel beta-helix repeat-containing protein [Acidobacteriota bacterium]